MIKAYSYIRFSSAKQAKGRSRERQIEKCEKYCAKHGLTLATAEEYTYFDQGKSAFKGEHLNPETGHLARFLAHVKAGDIEPGSYLIVESLDRLGRDNVMDALGRFLDILKDGVNIVTLMDDKTYTKQATSMEIIQSVAIMARAHEESATKAERVSDAYQSKQRAARDTKLPQFGSKPRWFEKELSPEGKYVENPVQVDAVRQIFKLCCAGFGMTTIARKLNEQKIPSPLGKTWGLSSVDKVLKNRAVIGEYQPHIVHGMKKRVPHGPAVEGFYPPIIEQEEFDRAQDAIRVRHITPSKRPAEHCNLYAGIGRCGLCGGALHFRKAFQGRHGFLYCSNRKKGNGCTAKPKRIEAAEAAFKHVLARLESSALVLDNPKQTERQLQAVRGQIGEKQKLREQYKETLKQRYVESLLDVVESLEGELKGLQDEAVKLERVIASHQIPYAEFIRMVDLTSYEGRNRANMLLKRLEVQIYVNVGYYVVQRGVPRFVLVDGGHYASAEMMGVDMVEVERPEVVDMYDSQGNYVESVETGDTETHYEAVDKPIGHSLALADSLARSLLAQVESGNQWVDRYDEAGEKVAA